NHASRATRREGPLSVTQKRSVGLVCGIAYAAVVLVLAWSRALEAPYLAAAAIALCAAPVAWWRLSRRPGTAEVTPARRTPKGLLLTAWTTLAAACAVAAVVEHRLHRLDAEWPRPQVTREARLTRELDRGMDQLIERSRVAAERAAEAAAAPDRGDMFATLGELRVRTGVAALALFDETGELIAWAGEHRGALPREAKLGEKSVFYAERPLFGYLYVTRPVEGRGERVVAAALLQTGLVMEQQGAVGFADRFAERMGARPYFTAGPGSEGSWSLVAGTDTVLHARFDPVSRVEWRSRLAQAGRRTVVPLALLSLVFLSVVWLRLQRGPGVATALPLIGLAGAMMVAPLGAVTGADTLFSPALYLLPVFGEPSLGRLLAVLLPLAALTASARPLRLAARSETIAIAVGALVVAIGFAGGLRLILAGAAPSLLEGGSAYWAAVQGAAFLSLTMVAALALPQGRPGPARIGALLAGAALCVVLAGAVVLRWRVTQRIETWTPLLWAAPFVLLAIGILRYDGRASR